MDLRFNLCYLDISQRAISHQRTIYLRQKANNWVSVDYRDLSKCQADIGLLVFNFWLWLLVRSWGMEACWKQCIPFHTLTKQEGGFTSLKKNLHWMTNEATAQTQHRALTKPHQMMLKAERRIQSRWVVNDWFHSKTMITTKPWLGPSMVVQPVPHQAVMHGQLLLQKTDFLLQSLHCSLEGKQKGKWMTKCY